MCVSPSRQPGTARTTVIVSVSLPPKRRSVSWPTSTMRVDRPHQHLARQSEPAGTLCISRPRQHRAWQSDPVVLVADAAANQATTSKKPMNKVTEQADKLTNIDFFVCTLNFLNQFRSIF
jgi:hypothetical protein